MIISTMDEQQICDELNKDLVAVDEFSKKRYKQVRHMVITSKLFPLYLYSFYTSPRKNRWLLCWESGNNKELGVTFICITNYDKEGKKIAIMSTTTNGKDHFIFFPPHFFSRYATRAGKSQSGELLIREYFKLNATFAYDLKDVPVLNSKEVVSTEVYGSSKEGVAMGIETEGGNVLFRTFITYDMTKGDQIALFADSERIREEIHGA